jgi:hypothetical protein
MIMAIVWHVQIETENGDLIERSVPDYKIPKKIGDRSLNGSFGAWLKKKFNVSQREESHVRSRIIHLYSED